MATSEELRMSQLQRKASKFRKQKRTINIAIFFIIIIICLITFVKCNYEKNQKPPAISAESLVLYPEPAEKTVDILASVPDSDGVKTAYLTFDDGPTTSVTTGILDILRRYDIKATFFVLGSLIDENPGVAYRIHSEGHLLANHSYRHNYSYLYENKENFMSEINETYDRIKKITGDKKYPKIFRFPGGSYESGTYGAAKQEYKKALDAAGYRYCDWNCLSGDAEYKNPGVKTLLNRVKSSAKGKEDLIILMHDAVTKKINLEALPAIIDYLLEEGYVFETLDKAP